MHLYHCTYRLFAFSVLIQYVGIVILGIEWIRYGMTGLGPHPTFGGLLAGVSEIAFLLLLLLMAKGYTITRARLSSCTIVKVTIFINTYIVAYIILYVYQAEAFDPGQVLNLYESPAGFGLSSLRCISWCVFMLSTATTIRKYPEKSTFYYPFGLLGSLWILGGPFLTLVGIGVLDAWVREGVMYLTFAILSFLGHAIFLVSQLYWSIWCSFFNWNTSITSYSWFFGNWFVYFGIAVDNVAIKSEQKFPLSRENESHWHCVRGRWRCWLPTSYGTLFLFRYNITYDNGTLFTNSSTNRRTLTKI